MSTPVEDAPRQVAPKVDPETLAIRSRPAGAIRFKRGAIIGIAVLGSASLMTVAWLALKPQVFHAVDQESELSEPASKAKSEGIEALPATYGDVPKLGPPLPGDLGRPILRAQRMTTERNAGSEQSVDDMRKQRLTDLKEARESGLMVQIATRSPGVAQSTPSALPAGDSEVPTMSTAGDGSNDRQHKEAFVSMIDRTGDSNPHALTAPASPYTLLAGSVIAASLITGLNSDIPGMAAAQISENVFDSVSGTVLLIPQGSRLIGSYDHVVAFGQKRALVIWQRLILPNGQSLRIDNAPASDPSGYAGLADKVDFHTWALLKGVAIATLLGVGSELTIDGESDLVEAIREAAQQNVSRAGDQLTSRNLSVPPTITIRPGAPVRLLVSKDLILAPWRG